MGNAIPCRMVVEFRPELLSGPDSIVTEAMSSMLGLCLVFVCVPTPVYPLPPPAPRRQRRWPKAVRAAPPQAPRRAGLLKDSKNIWNCIWTLISYISCFFCVSAIHLPDLLIGVGFGAVMALKTHLWRIDFVVVWLFDLFFKNVLTSVYSRHRNSIFEAWISVFKA